MFQIQISTAVNCFDGNPLCGCRGVLWCTWKTEATKLVLIVWVSNNNPQLEGEFKSVFACQMSLEHFELPLMDSLSLVGAKTTQRGLARWCAPPRVNGWCSICMTSFCSFLRHSRNFCCCHANIYSQLRNVARASFCIK